MPVVRSRRLHGDGTSHSFVAARLVYVDSIAPIREGTYIVHRCGDRQCLNPAHLEARAPAANLGIFSRPRSGARNPNAKLTLELVKEIRLRNAAGEGQRRLAAEFGVSKSSIGRAVRRETWPDTAEN